MRVVFVHGACVQDGAWWWHRAGEELVTRGIASLAPSLPSCGEEADEASASSLAGLREDVDAVRGALVTSDEPTVVVAHSYGGIVASEAIAGLPAVRHLLLVSSYLPEVGESLSTFGAEEPAPFLDIDPQAGRFTVRVDSLAQTFLHDCDPVIQTAARSRTAWQNLSVLQEPVDVAGWKDVPTTYLVCAEDRGTPAEAQRAFAARADTVVEMEAGHHPFLSAPAAVADLIVGL